MVHLEYVQFNVCQLYFNKIVKNQNGKKKVERTRTTGPISRGEQCGWLKGPKTMCSLSEREYLAWGEESPAHQNT